ncbi:hypothetical protein Q9L42_016445 [Methylomarinum sp. Ch1-1]|uniref:Uncharacterized protein n=1 Tax=Methylomarinum roseum TaxID=3067653 RepID=A0AAU7NSK0_9GAMM|nr:hypothetical protein [Methylomarinum sp. Ch1-1]MDP4520074.1 hypothetical protein [Methylomarinum sp. Ch1-1]
MKERQSAQNEGLLAQTPLWEFVRLTDYRQPSATGASAARLKWASFKRFSLRFEAEDLAPLKEESELQSLSKVGLAHLVAEIDWDKVAQAFDAALGDWRKTLPADSPVKFVVGPPFTGHGEMLGKWAARHGLCRVDAPDVEQILGAHQGWLMGWPQPDRQWVLPHLEHCYLRHANGLGLVRQLLERAVAGELGHGIIGCDSWAWAYLQHVWPIPQWDVLTLQGFDGARLARLFFQLAAGAEREQLCFKNARTGKIVLAEPDDEDHEISPELSQLAAYCRGNFGLARNYWRERLRAEPEQEEDQAEDDEEKRPLLGAREQCIWVSDVPQEPVLPVEKEEDMAFIMHVLLLHNGLPASILPELLPLPFHRIMSLLLRLRALGIVVSHNDVWRISAMGYTSAREYLRARDYSLDGF